MNVRPSDKGGIRLDLSEQEVWMIQHGLAELCSQVACPDHEFPARVGASYEAVSNLALELRQKLCDIGVED
jgi:hypothetical protein